MNRARIRIATTVTTILVSLLSPIIVEAAHTASDAKNRHSIQRAFVEGAVPVSDEERVRRLMSQLLPNMPGKEVVILAITYPPGKSGAIHKHNANVFAYVLEGSVVMGLNNSVPVTLTPGQTFYEGPSDVHTISRNASKTKKAKFLVFLIKDKGAPITVPAK